MKSISPPLAVALALIASTGVGLAQTQTKPTEPKATSEIEQMLINGLTTGMNMIALTLGSVIPYELPEILPNGDIIIRHKPSNKNPPADNPAEPALPRNSGEAYQHDETI